jgi:hypothetical protein
MRCIGRLFPYQSDRELGEEFYKMFDGTEVVPVVLEQEFLKLREENLLASGAALAAMTRGIEMVHQRVPQVYVEGRWERDESREVEVAPMGNPLEATGLLREGQAIELFNRSGRRLW